MLSREVIRNLAGYFTAAAALWLAAGLSFSAFVLWAFAEVIDEVVEGESRAFDRAVLLWIDTYSPDWLERPMLLITALGYYWVVLPLLLAAVVVFKKKGRRLSAVLLIVSTAGGSLLTTTLKAVFQRTRPEIFDSGYTASFYSFPSGHATVAVGFFGALALLVAWRLEGWRRWTVAVAGAALVVLIGFSRLYLGVHYPTDVLAGYLAATIWLCVVGGVLLFWHGLRRLRKGYVGRGEGAP